MKIALLTKRFLDLSETFIYQPLMLNSQKEEVSVYALERRNQQNFDYKQIFTLDSLGVWQRKLALFLGTLGMEPFILKEMKKNKIELIHAHYGYMGIYACQFAKKLRVPLIVSFYGLDVYKHTRSFFYRQQLKRLFKRANLLTVCSQKMCQDLINLGADSKKVVVIYGAVDLQKYQFQIPKNQPATEILMCGRFVEKKGFIYGIKAFKKLTAQNLKLKIIGSGPLSEQLKTVASDDPKITFLGNQSYEQYMQHLQKADILLVPSVTASDGDQEGLPTVLIEASALGTILVASRHSGIPEIVQNGYLAKERDVDNLSQQLDLAIKQKNAWPLLAAKQLEFVKANFDLHKQTEKIRDLYRQLA